MIGSRAVGVDLIVPLTSRRQSFSLVSTFLVCALWPQTGAQYSAAEKHMARADVRRTSKLEPQ